MTVPTRRRTRRLRSTTIGTSLRRPDRTRPGSGGPHPGAGSVYGPVLQSMLADETARKASLEQRALAVMSSAGALTTLVLASAALLWGSDGPAQPPLASKLLVVVAIGAFIGATVCALLANRPRPYLTFGVEDIDRMVRGWNSDSDEATLLVAAFHGERVKSATRLNDVKGRLVQGAVAMAVGGIVALAAAVILTVWD